MKKLLCWLCLIIPCLLNALVIESPHASSMLQYVDEETWVLVDLDNCFFEAKQALGHAQWFYDLMQDELAQGYCRNEAIARAYPHWITTQKVCPVKPLEEEFIAILKGFQQRGIIVIGLTHRHPSIADSTVKQVASLGFDFSLTAPSDQLHIVPAEYPTLYWQGIMFVCDYNKKSDVFLNLTDVIGKRPKKVLFIDDNRKYVDELAEVLPAKGIYCTGIHYTAINFAPKVYNRKLADFQYTFLKKILSNEAAVLLLEAGLE